MTPVLASAGKPEPPPVTAVSADRISTLESPSITRPPAGIWITLPTSSWSELVRYGGAVWKRTGQSSCSPSSGAHSLLPSPSRSAVYANAPVKSVIVVPE